MVKIHPKWKPRSRARRGGGKAVRALFWAGLGAAVPEAALSGAGFYADKVSDVALSKYLSASRKTQFEIAVLHKYF